MDAFFQGSCNARNSPAGAWGTVFSMLLLLFWESFKYMLVSVLWFRVDVDCKDRKLPFRLFCVCLKHCHWSWWHSCNPSTPENEAFGSSLDNRTKQGRLGWGLMNRVQEFNWFFSFFHPCCFNKPTGVWIKGLLKMDLVNLGNLWS